MLQVQPQDVMGALNGLGAIQNPSGTALSFLGLSPDEQRAGVPAWAWMILALGAGVYVGSKYGNRIRAIL